MKNVIHEQQHTPAVGAFEAVLKVVWKTWCRCDVSHIIQIIAYQHSTPTNKVLEYAGL